MLHGAALLAEGVAGAVSAEELGVGEVAAALGGEGVLAELLAACEAHARSAEAMWVFVGAW